MFIEKSIEKKYLKGWKPSHNLFYRFVLSTMSLSLVSKRSHPASQVLLSKLTCACCSQDMNCNPFGIVAVSLTAKMHLEAQRHYFPFYHLVCKPCYERLFNEEDNVLEFVKNNKPSWSFLDQFVKYEHRPGGISELSDKYDVEDLITSVNQSTSTWEDYRYVLEFFASPACMIDALDSFETELIENF
jgi:hypothetical protein